MIARPHPPIPAPDAVALFAARQLPARIRDAVDEAGLCGRLLTGRTLAAVPATVRMEPAVRLHARLCEANKALGARNPGLIIGWADTASLPRSSR